MKIGLDSFNGIVPRVDSKLLPENNAQIAENCYLDSGKIIPIKETTNVTTVAAGTKNIYKNDYNYYVMTGGTPGLLAAFTAITSGNFILPVNGTDYNVSGINLSGAGTLAAVASTIQTAVRSAVASYMTCNYGVTASKFDLTHTLNMSALKPYLDTTVDRTNGTAVGDMTANGGLAASFDGNASQSYVACSTGTTNPAYVGKDWGAAETRIIKSATVVAANDSYGWCSVNARTITLTLRGSNNGSSWTTLGTETATSGTDARAESKTITSTDTTTEYRYHSVLISTGTASDDVYFAEMTFTGSDNLTYRLPNKLNMTSGNVTFTRSTSSSWLSWTEDWVQVAKSPVVEDQYKRIYYTGKSDGYLYEYGTMGARAQNLPTPTMTATFTPTDLYAEATWTGRLSVDADPAGSPPATPAAYTQALTFQGAMKTDTGYQLTFWNSFYGATYDGLPGYRFEFQELGSGAWLGEADIGDKVEKDDSGTAWGEREITSIDSTGVSFEPGSTTTPYPINIRPGNVVLTINMNYKYPQRYSYYAFTYVNDLGEEGPMSAVSELVTKDGDEKVVITDIPVSTDSNITHKRIYRTTSGSSSESDAFRLVAQITNATTTYTDWIKESDLILALEPATNPPLWMKGIVAHPAGFLAAFRDNVVHVTGQYRLWSWETEYPVADNIVNLAISGNDIVVLTEGKPYLLSGIDPANLRQEQLMVNQACNCARSVAQHGYNVVYSSPDGLVLMANGQAQLITEKLISKDQWTAYSPTTGLGAVWDSKYHFFTSAETLIFDFNTEALGITTSDETASALFSDTLTDTLYLVQSTNLDSWNTSSTAKLATWRSRNYQFPIPIEWVCVRVRASAYSTVTPILLRLYANNAQVLESTILNGNTLKIPILRKEEVWAFEVLSYATINQIDIATSVGSLIGGEG